MTMMMEKKAERAIQEVTATRRSALSDMADRYQISQENLMNVIKKTCIKGNCSDAEFQAFIVVANQYGLNPMTREIHAFASNGAIVPIVGIDGWSKIVNGQPRYDGCEFEEIDAASGDVGITCVMYVKDRAHPVRLTEWLSECKRNTAPWNQMKRRMLRHKAFMQAARLAFSVGGIFDEDEARDITDNSTASLPTASMTGTASTKAKLMQKPLDDGKVLDLTDSQELPDDTSDTLASSSNAPKDVIQTNQDSQTKDVEAPKKSDGDDAYPANCTLNQLTEFAIRKLSGTPAEIEAQVKAGLERRKIMNFPGATSKIKSGIWKEIASGKFD